MKRVVFAILACVISMASSPLHAQGGYPSRPIRLVVPFTAGGIGDVLARIIGKSISEQMGQPVIVDNRPGAGGTVGTQYAAKAAPDGYTILQVSSPQIINQTLRKQPGYSLLRDFMPVTRVIRSPFVLVVPISSPIRTVHDLVALAKTKPGGLNFGSGGIGSVGHLSGELFKRSAHLAAIHIAYKGDAEVISDLIGGRLDFFFAPQSEAVTGVASGRLRAIAVTAPARVHAFPSVPTMIESGYPDFVPSSFYGYMVRAKTPAFIVARLNDAITKAIVLPSVQEQFKTLGLNVDEGGPAEWGATLKSESARWEKVVHSAHLSLD